jgi:monoamine oxidase
MPTMFTMLRARHAEVPPREAAPTAKRRPGRVKAPLLATQLGIAPAPATITASETLQGVGQPPIARKTRKKMPNVIVVGAGFAGLCAAYELMGLGFAVTVLEARDRVGGRVWSLSRGLVPDRVLEGGGELIGANHPLWLSYRQQFHLSFSNVAEYENSPIRLDGRTLSFTQTKQLNKEMHKMLKRLTDLAETIIDPFEPWINRDARRLDRLSLADWLEQTKGKPACKRAVAQMLAADNGVPAAKQSLLGVLAMIKGGGLDRYWSDTEVYRCKGGNQQLAECFEAQLNEGNSRVLKNSPVCRIARSGGIARVWVKGMETSHEADHVILAIPPSVWHTITFTDRKLAARLRPAPKMGSNVKYLMRLGRRFWQDFGGSPTLSEDGPVDITWETTEAEPNDRGKIGLVAFSGAQDASKCTGWRSNLRRRHYVRALEPAYPNLDRENGRRASVGISLGTAASRPARDSNSVSLS